VKNQDGTNRMRRRLLHLALIMAGTTMFGDGQVLADWSQWGGPDRNFVVDTSSLADTWPDAGPKRMWRHKLGTGYSGIAVDNGVLYTMYRTKRRSSDEYVVALNAATGKRIWRHKERAKITKKSPPGSRDTTHIMYTGPNTTPLVVGERVFTIGRNAILLCLTKANGNLQWKKDLQSEFQPQEQRWGFSSSPIAFGSTIIVPFGPP
jgi:glucose dehydrogenase